MARQINGSHTYQRSNVAARLAVALVTSLLTLCESEAIAHARFLPKLTQQSANCSGATQDEKVVPTLEPGKPLERELNGSEFHCYKIPLISGHLIHIVVDQRGIDIAVSFSGPDGNHITEVDNPNGTHGPEPLSLKAEASGIYLLKVRPLDKGVVTGRYEVKIEELRIATAKDNDRIAAEKAYAEAVHLRRQGTAESRQKAIEKYQEALPLWRADGDRRREASTLHSMCVVYVGLDEFQKALDSLNQALPLWRVVGDRRAEARTLFTTGEVYDSLGDKQKALDSYDRALLLWRSISAPSWEAVALTSIGRLYSSTDEYQKALDYLHQALLVRREIGNRRAEAYTLHNIGSIYCDLGEPQAALDYLRQALLIRRQIINQGGEASTLHEIARVERDRGRLTEARTQIEAALNIVETLRTKLIDQELRTSYRAAVQRYYEFYTDLLMRLHKQHPSDGHDAIALQTSERARARSLVEALSEARADIRQDVDPGLLQRERTLQQQLNVKADRQTRLLGGRHTAEQAVAIKKQIDALTTEYQQVQTQIRQRSPRYAALTQPAPLTLREIRTEVLDADTLLLEYALGEERTYLWAVTQKSITSHELPRRAEVETLARRVYDLLTARNKHP
ncbi:MAG: tetratricopeptide repeat protein, partial [Acidobacteriota bacterium]|nr:tetratricopeptide repeat protein [Acidobacteriota bacterium]